MCVEPAWLETASLDPRQSHATPQPCPEPRGEHRAACLDAAMTKRGGAPCETQLLEPKGKAAARAPLGAQGTPAPAVLLHTPPHVPGIIPQAPVLPIGAEATNYCEEKTRTLMRAIVAYNKHHVRRVMKEDSRWFNGWADLPVHEHQPLTIRKPDSKLDLLSYNSPWKNAEATISFQGTGTYKGGGNVFWLDPFVDRSRTKMSSIAGDPPLYSACLDAAENYALGKIHQQGVAQGKVSAAHEARIKFPHVFTIFAWDLAMYEADHFDSSLPLVCGHVALWGFHLALMKALVRGDMASVAVLVQAALCAPIEGVIVENEEKLCIISMEKSE